ncbi:MAG: GTP-binding protein [Kiritimatiellae bacterium]|nr:GTP-binding protein [Kiritimatiellia bacterium]
MIKKKVCMLGAFSVGKTSLVRQFVTSVFSDKYLTTVGVKVNKKSITLETTDMDLLIWDIYGEDNLQSISPSYLRGAAGHLLVLDGTRRETFDIAVEIDEKIERLTGKVPIVVLINKCDLEADWEITSEAIEKMEARGWRVFCTSAKTGQGVEEAFKTLAMAIY